MALGLGFLLPKQDTVEFADALDVIVTFYLLGVAVQVWMWFVERRRGTAESGEWQAGYEGGYRIRELDEHRPEFESDEELYAEDCDWDPGLVKKEDDLVASSFLAAPLAVLLIALVVEMVAVADVYPQWTKLTAALELVAVPMAAWYWYLRSHETVHAYSISAATREKFAEKFRRQDERMRRLEAGFSVWYVCVGVSVWWLMRLTHKGPWEAVTRFVKMIVDVYLSKAGGG